METTDINFPSDQPTDLVLATEAKYFLHTAARWANFLAILGFIATGVMVILALLMLVVGGVSSQLMQSQSAGTAGMYGSLLSSLGSGFIAFIYLIVAVFYFFYSFYLFRFAVSSKKAVLFNNSFDITKAFENLKSFFKLWGIVTIVAIALGILCFIGGIIFAVSMASSMHS
jgi:hypothetical protein